MTYVFPINDNKTKFMSYERFNAIIRMIENNPTAILIHHYDSTDIVIANQRYNIDNEGVIASESQ